MSVFEIRPHHGLCIHFFEGKGYSENFVRHMAELIEELNTFRPEIRLVLHVDYFCYACPRNLGSICESAGKVLQYDKNILNLCHLEENQILSWEDFQEKIFFHILNAGKLSLVCSGCQWENLCTRKTTG